MNFEPNNNYHRVKITFEFEQQKKHPENFRPGYDSNPA